MSSCYLSNHISVEINKSLEITDETISYKLHRDVKICLDIIFVLNVSNKMLIKAHILNFLLSLETSKGGL